jgi:hypothetical protein
MTPKEKALQLFQLFGTAIAERVDEDGFICNTEQAKQCAITSVDFTIQTLSQDIRDVDVRGNILLDLINYWIDVKQEIEKL